MPEVRSFDNSVFSSYSNLQNFLNRSDSITQVLSRKNSSFTKPLKEMHPNLARKWKVCQVATAPLRGCSAIVLNICARILKKLGLSSISKNAKNLSDRSRIGFNAFATNSTHIYFISKSINQPNNAGKNVHTAPLIPKSQITDLKILKRSFWYLNGGISFGSKGICLGMSNWFINLYLKTKDQFTDPRVQMAAIGKQFVHGAGMDPTLLQSVNLNKGKLLNLKVGVQAQGFHNSLTPSFKKTIVEWETKRKETITELQNFSNGIYFMTNPTHAMVYVKINQKLGYFFDPNTGIVEINGQDQAEKLYEIFTDILNTLSFSWKQHDDCYKNIIAHPVTIRRHDLPRIHLESR